MVSLEHVKCKCSLPRHNASQMNFTGVPFRGNLSSVNIPVYKSGRPTITDGCCRELLFAFDEEQTLLDSLLLAQWEDVTWKNLVRYDVTSCATKLVSGDRNFVAKLNEHWSFRIGNSQQPGDFVCSDLNILVEDILLCVTTGDKNDSELILSAAVPKDSIVIILNDSPVEYGHVFLLPYNLHNPINFLGSLESIIRITAEVNNCSFRVFYDSPASSNSNHIYFQACYFANDFAVENMPTISICTGLKNEGIDIYEIANYPMKALMFSTKHKFRMLIEVVSEICSCLTNQNARYNLLISDSGRKVFLFLQVQKLSNNPSLSAWECGGHFVYSAYNDFDNANEDDIIERMAAASLDDEGFRAVKQLCCDVTNKLFSLGHVL